MRFHLVLFLFVCFPNKYIIPIKFEFCVYLFCYWFGVANKDISICCCKIFSVHWDTVKGRALINGLRNLLGHLNHNNSKCMPLFSFVRGLDLFETSIIDFNYNCINYKSVLFVKYVKQTRFSANKYFRIIGLTRIKVKISIGYGKFSAQKFFFCMRFEALQWSKRKTYGNYGN